MREDLLRNPEELIELFFVVVNKKQETVPFFLNDVQRHFLGTINKALKDYKAGRRNHLRFMVLKGRQQGFTTVITAYQLACALTQRNFSGFTLADNAENTESIFQDKAKFPYEHLPGAIKPAERFNNRREFHFQKESGDGLNSRWRVNTAGNREVGRSKTLNFFHGSEAAFWDNLKGTLVGLGEALTANCVTILESTANGFNDYRDLWDEENNWECLFYEWWLTPEYRLTFESVEKRKRFVRYVKGARKDHTSENPDNPQWAYRRCRWLKINKKLDWEQLYWYYNKWLDKKESIKQEYPCSPEESFLASGRPYFNIERIAERLSVLRSADTSPDGALRYRKGFYTYKYYLDPLTEQKHIDHESIVWNEHEQGCITIYKEPTKGGGYAMGGDTATTGIDRNIAQVLDGKGEQVAVLRIEDDEDVFADQEYCLGMFYNWAMIANEVNHSTHPTKVLMERDYPRLYIRGGQPDSFSGQLQKKYGYRTMQGNRSTMLGALRQVVRDETEKINDIDTLEEMLTFVINDRNKPVAEEGEHDDYIMALAIAGDIREEVDDEIVKDESELSGFYTREELEDLGYSKYEIGRYLERRRVWGTT